MNEGFFSIVTLIGTFEICSQQPGSYFVSQNGHSFKLFLPLIPKLRIHLILLLLNCSTLIQRLIVQQSLVVTGWNASEDQPFWASSILRPLKLLLFAKYFTIIVVAAPHTSIVTILLLNSKTIDEHMIFAKNIQPGISIGHQSRNTLSYRFHAFAVE